MPLGVVQDGIVVTPIAEATRRRQTLTRPTNHPIIAPPTERITMIGTYRNHARARQRCSITRRRVEYMAMSFWRRRLRGFTWAWAVLQIALPAAVSFADAIDALDSASRARIHVEATSSSSCRPAHAEECALCRFLSTSNGTSARGDIPLPEARRTAGVPVDVIQRCATAARGQPGSRAPPIG